MSSVEYLLSVVSITVCVFFFQAEDGIRDLVRSRGLGDVYKRQVHAFGEPRNAAGTRQHGRGQHPDRLAQHQSQRHPCLLYTSDAADERSSVDLGGRRILKKKKKTHQTQNNTNNDKTRRQ